MSTVFATVTQPGPPGATGATGYSPQFIVQAGSPTAGLGQNGDMFIDSSTGNVWGPKANNAWPGAPACNIKGPTGATGATGYTPQYIVQAGPPNNSIGQNSDMYVNSSSSDVYGPKSGGVWGGIVCNIKGAAGATGPQGPPGVGYVAKGAWAAGTTYNQGDQVSDVNLLYISLAGGNVGHTPASSPTWWVSVGSAASQSPWLSDIDGATKTLQNVGRIAAGNPGATIPDAGSASVHVIVGPITVSSSYGEVTACGNSAAVTAPMGILNFANYNISATEKRVAAIVGYCDGAVNSGNLTFYTWNAGTPTQVALMDHLGNLMVDTQTALARLTVSAASIHAITATYNGTDTGIMVQNTATSGRQYSIYSSGGASSLGAGNFTIFDDTAAVARVTITPSGNVGIGMVPAYKLDVNGAIQFVNYMYSQNGRQVFQTTDTSYLRINQNGDFSAGIWIGGSSFLMNSGYLRLGSTGVGSGDINISATGQTGAARINIDGNAGGAIIFNTKGIFNINTPTSTGALTLLPASNPTSIATTTTISIGEAGDNPGYRLNMGLAAVVGGSGWCAIIQANPIGLPILLQPSGGNVAIGGAASAGPLYTLDVNGNCRATSGFFTNSKGNAMGTASGTSNPPATSDANILLYNFSAVNWAGIGCNSNGDMWFKTGLAGNPQPVLTLQANPPRVGVQQQLPNYDLDVTGDINCSGNFRKGGVIFSGGGGMVFQSAQCSGAVTLTSGSYSDVPGCTLTLSQAGRWWITASFDCIIASGDSSTQIQGFLLADGVQQTLMTYKPATVPVEVSMFQQWVVVFAGAGKVVKLQAWKPGGTAAASIGTGSMIAAVWVAAS